MSMFDVTLLWLVLQAELTTHVEILSVWLTLEDDQLIFFLLMSNFMQGSKKPHRHSAVLLLH